MWSRPLTARTAAKLALVHAKCRQTFLLNPFLDHRVVPLQVLWADLRTLVPIKPDRVLASAKSFSPTQLSKRQVGTDFGGLLCLVYLASLSLLALFLLLSTILVRLAVGLYTFSTRTYRPLQSRLPKGSA